MPIADYHGETFVAFTDISGFKVLMQQQDKAIEALDKFYTIGFFALQDENAVINPKVEGIFISDCGVMFVRQDNELNKELSLDSLLRVIERINREMLEEGYMLTTSIAYGDFSYHQRIEYLGIEKNPIYGNAYVKAFIDNEGGHRKMEPGQCRILKEQSLQNLNINGFPAFNKLIEDKHYYNYYWMVNDAVQIERFNEEYKNTYNLKYKGMLDALRNAPML